MNWTKQQNFEVRANAGARIIEPNKDSDYRHYIIVGNEGDQPVELLSMFKPLFKGSKAHTNNSSISLSRKKNFGGTMQ